MLGVLVALEGEHTAGKLKRRFRMVFRGLTFYQVIIIGEWVVSFGVGWRDWGEGLSVTGGELGLGRGEESCRKKLWDVPCVSSARCEGLVGGEYCLLITRAKRASCWY